MRIDPGPTMQTPMYSETAIPIDPKQGARLKEPKSYSLNKNGYGKARTPRRAYRNTNERCKRSRNQNTWGDNARPSAPGEIRHLPRARKQQSPELHIRAPAIKIQSRAILIKLRRRRKHERRANKARPTRTKSAPEGSNTTLRSLRTQDIQFEDPTPCILIIVEVLVGGGGPKKVRQDMRKEILARHVKQEKRPFQKQQRVHQLGARDI